MAPPLLSAARRHGWLVVAVAAGLALAVAAVWSPERRSSLADTPAAGALAPVAAERIRRVVVVQAARERTFARGPQGWDGPTDTLETGLRLLRNSVPERRFESATPEFGLDAPALVVRVFTDADAPVLEVAFGAANPLGLARYARVTIAGRSELQLLPGYVADTWTAIGTAP